MKKTRSIFGMILILSISFLITGCSQDSKDDNPLSPVPAAVDPAPPAAVPEPTSFLYKMDGVQVDNSVRCGGFYDLSYSETVLGGWDNNSTYKPILYLNTPGKTTGTFTETDGAWALYVVSTNEVYYINLNSNNVCLITINSIGGVGKRIKGSFTLEMTNITSSTPTDKIMITDGSFNIIREPDFGTAVSMKTVPAGISLTAIANDNLENLRSLIKK
ncbi:MAG: hypothetical protein KKH98_15015 [Spirochaetes bacterium]|nr:hypothetical protein [Spirochaetota bacterium]